MEEGVGFALGMNKVGRMQSPSSINTFKQCPRKYYYQYIEKRPVQPNINLLKGSIVHSVLEDFFDLESLGLEFKNTLRLHAAKLLHNKWTESKEDLDILNLDNPGLHFDDAAIMVSNWLERFIAKVERKSALGLSISDSYLSLIPKRELEFKSDGYAVRGFIDAIEEHEDGVRLIDYKTSKSAHISDQYYLQLAIYALLYQEQHNVLPKEVALNFLRHGEKGIEVTPRMVEFAKKELKHVHTNTLSTDIKDYPPKKGPLCKYSSGQCDFYDCCFCSGC